jgi:flagellin
MAVGKSGDSVEHGLRSYGCYISNDGTQILYGSVTVTSADDFTIGGSSVTASGLTAGDYTAAGAGTYELDFDNGTTISIGTAGSTVTAQDVVDAIGSTGTTGVSGYSAQLNDAGEVEITKVDASNFTLQENIDADGDGSEDTVSSANGGLAGVDGSGATDYRGLISLSGSADITLAENTSGALAGIGLDNVGNATTTIDQLDISTVAGSTTAISSVDAALQQINEMRGAMGAVQSRFESTINNLQSASENIAAARSRIVDADFAAETAELTKAQILQQAGTAMLAQANQLPQAVLALIQ